MIRRQASRQSAVSTRDRILQVALARFLVGGSRGTSVRDIADDVGVTQPALYYHFGSKDGILAALIEPLLAAGDDLLAELAVLSGERATVARRALEGYYDAIAAHLDVSLFVESDRSVRSHPEAGHRLAAQATELLDLLAEDDRPPHRVQAAAALGAIRRPLRLPDVDVDRDRAQILASALAALTAVPDPAV